MLKNIKGNSKLISEHDLLTLSEKVVARYVFAKTIPEKDMEDVKMAMVEKFLLKQDTISKAFNGKSKITTYCIAVLNRMCCEVIRKELKHWKNRNDEIPEEIIRNNVDYVGALMISDEVNFLHGIMLMFGNDFYKLKLFLAFFYRLCIRELDVVAYGKNEELFDLLNTDEVKNKGEVFERLAIVVNKVENKELKPDAIRMWLNKHIDKIVLRLNGPFERANYDKETLQILFEYYYLNILNTELKIKKEA